MTTNITEDGGKVPLMNKMLSDYVQEYNWVAFSGQSINTSVTTGRYLVCVKDKDVLILMLQMIDSLGDFDVTHKSSELAELRSSCFEHASLHREGRDSECGFAVFDLSCDEWFYAPYSVNELNSDNHYKRLEEVLSDVS